MKTQALRKVLFVVLLILCLFIESIQAQGKSPYHKNSVGQASPARSYSLGAVALSGLGNAEAIASYEAIPIPGSTAAATLTQTNVNPNNPAVIPSIMEFCPSVSEKGWRTTINISNIDSTDGWLNILYFNSDGTIALTSQDTIQKNGSRSYHNVPYVGFEGSAVVESNVALVAVVNKKMEGKTSFLSYHGQNSGFTQVILPKIRKSWNGWNTEFWIQNVDGVPADVTIEFRPLKAGSSYAVTDYLLPGASKVFKPAEISSLGSTFFGWVKITSLRPITAVAIEMDTASDKADAYNGEAWSFQAQPPVTIVMKKLYFPYQLKNVDGFSTDVSLFNPTSQDGYYTALYHDANGMNIWIKDGIISPESLIELFPEENSNLPEGFNGFLEIQTDLPLMILNTLNNPNSSLGDLQAIFEVISFVDTGVALPHVINMESKGLITQFSILNLNPVQSASIQITYYNQDGSVKTTYSDGIPLNGVKRYSTSDVPQLGTDWEGSVKIISTNNTVIIGNVLQIITNQSPISGNITGRITDSKGAGLGSVRVNAGIGYTTYTDNNGYYQFSGLASGQYTLTPALTNYTFSPLTRKVNLPPDATGQNFIGTTCTTSQWYAEYYNNRDLQGLPVLTACDQKIDFNWGKSSPNNLYIQVDNFSIRWSRSVNFTNAGWYRFRSLTDDGIRLFVDGNKIIDDWSARSFDERSASIQISQGTHQIVMEYVEWANDAMAYLNWYLCPNGANDCSANIPLMYQTQYLDKPMPSTCTTEPNQTIARWGCLITSISMALQKYGLNTNPSQLNDWLSVPDIKRGGKPRGYTKNCNGSLVWSSILQFTQEPEQGGLNLKWQSTNNAIKVIRDEALPVIMKVAKGGHYTLAVDIANINGVDILGINDPHHSWACKVIAGIPSLPPNSVLQCNIGPLKHATTIAEENTYRGTSVPLQYLKYQTQLHTPSLQVDINGAELLLIDSQGRRVGFDSTTGNTLLEVPNSLYFDSEIVPSGEVSSGILQRTLYLPEGAGGSYKLHVINPANQSFSMSNPNTGFEIDIIGFDSEFNPLETAEMRTLGTIQEYEINFVPGQIITITPHIKIYIPIVEH